MSKTNVILICIIVALVSGIIGFIIGTNTKLSFDNSSSNLQAFEEDDFAKMVGTYKTNSWNGKEGVLVLKEDKTAIYPTGQRTYWIYENNHLYLTSETGENRQELEIVDGGIMINTHFFEKVK